MFCWHVKKQRGRCYGSRNLTLNEDFSKFTGDRLLPAVMIWGKDRALDKVAEPKAVKPGKARAPILVCMLRTSWNDRDAIFVGFRPVLPPLTMVSMDIGSFVMEADGTKMGHDLGVQDYESLRIAKGSRFLASHPGRPALEHLPDQQQSAQHPYC